MDGNAVANSAKQYIILKFDNEQYGSIRKVKHYIMLQMNAIKIKEEHTLFQLAMKAGYDINTEVGRLETLLGEKR